MKHAQTEQADVANKFDRLKQSNSFHGESEQTNVNRSVVSRSLRRLLDGETKLINAPGVIALRRFATKAILILIGLTKVIEFMAAKEVRRRDLTVRTLDV